MTLVALLCVTLFASCSTRPKLIEETELKDIISEMMRTDAIIQTKNESSKYDSLDTYATILQRHGYTRADLSYTIGEMAGRKSNPLNNIFEQIKAELTGEASATDDRFSKLRGYDSLARAISSDTIYRSEQSLKPPFGRHKITLDTVLAGGEYTLFFDYKTHASYDLSVRTVTITALNSDSTKRVRSATMMNRTSTFTPLKYTIQVPEADGFKGLVITFNDPKPEKSFKGMDTTVVKNICIVYEPPLARAREMLFQKVSGVDIQSYILEKTKNYDQLWNYRQPTDSLAVDTTAGRRAGARRSDDL